MGDGLKVLSSATDDIVRPLYLPQASEARITLIIRMVIIAVGVVASLLLLAGCTGEVLAVSKRHLFPLQPLASLLSRRHEFEADAFAAGQADARDLVSALVKLYEDNAATLTPDPIHSTFYDSHPPAAERIGRLEHLVAAAAAAAATGATGAAA